MLLEFVRAHRLEIIERCRARAAQRIGPRGTLAELEHGIPMFLRELENTLSELDGYAEIATTAGRHGGDLLRRGCTVAQVVHDYGDACQTITALAIEHDVEISTLEFRGLNLCLDNAIAEAVTEFERQRELDLIAKDVRCANQRLGFLAHELRNLIASSVLAFDILRAGLVGIRGSTGDTLGRSLIGLRDLVDRSLTEVRLTAGVTRPERIPVAELVDEIEASASLGASARGVELTVSEVEPGLAVHADRQILASLVFNLLQNAFKYTRPRSHVWLRIEATDTRVRFNVEDQCGGLPPGKLDRLFEPFQQQSEDRSGLGLGLAICARGAAALHGEIRAQNLNRGCVFTIDLPRLAG
jgi:signal transduction histidine kinase